MHIFRAAMQALGGPVSKNAVFRGSVKQPIGREDQDDAPSAKRASSPDSGSGLDVDVDVNTVDAHFDRMLEPRSTFPLLPLLRPAPAPPRTQQTPTPPTPTTHSTPSPQKPTDGPTTQTASRASRAPSPSFLSLSPSSSSSRKDETTPAPCEPCTRDAAGAPGAPPKSPPPARTSPTPTRLARGCGAERGICGRSLVRLRLGVGFFPAALHVQRSPCAVPRVLFRPVAVADGVNAGRRTAARSCSRSWLRSCSWLAEGVADEGAGAAPWAYELEIDTDREILPSAARPKPTPTSRETLPFPNRDPDAVPDTVRTNFCASLSCALFFVVGVGVEGSGGRWTW
ncbi:hypothetical protein B0H13DRAFT_2683755 [Mycena leptocephala]|nr:hypothetical protein B0H13DRAFT_2683755 [Mycena leptocephala]